MPSAYAAGPPVLATGTNTFDGHGGSVVRAYVNRKGETLTSCLFEYGETEAYGQSEACLGRDEVQTIQVFATAGQFRLRFGGEATPDLPFNASAALIQERLEALPAIGQGGVSVGGGELFFRIAFIGSLADRNVETLGWEQGTEPLSGGAATVAIATEVQGGASGLEYLNAGPAGEAIEVTMDPQGLKPGAVYHFRIKATSAAGIETSSDSVFLTPAEPEEPSSCHNEAIRADQHSAYLPDCRAYEMVSPPDKNGGDVCPCSWATYTSPDGSTAAFSSTTAFAGAVGTGTATDYISQRTGEPGTGGWSTHAITPPQPPQTFGSAAFGLSPAYQGFSPDLSKGVVSVWRPLTEEPNVAGVANLYLRSDLGVAGAGSYDLLTPCPSCTSPLQSIDMRLSWGAAGFVEASEDMGKVVFQDGLNLVDPAAGRETKVYEMDHGALRVASILPNAACAEQGRPAGCAAKEATAGGASQQYPFSSGAVDSVSADGSKVFFTAESSSPGSCRECAGVLYMRVDGTETVQLNRSERVPPASPQPAVFQGASADGSRVFLTSQEPLTADAPANTGRKLYMYDTTKPASDPHNLTYISIDREPADGGADVAGVIGMSPDGSTVYFSNVGQLVPGAPLQPERDIYAWREGTVSLVAPISVGEGELEQLMRNGALTPRAHVYGNGDLLFEPRIPIGPTGFDQGSCALGCREVYLYRPATTSLQCVSCDPSGAPPHSESSSYAPQQGFGGTRAMTIHVNRAMTTDGSRVFFNTAEALVSEDTNGAEDAYEYDTATGALRLLSSGTSGTASYFVESTPDGATVLMATRQRLVGWDRDSNLDFYAARVDGGFSEPPPAPAPCEGESCRGRQAPAPAPAAVGSSAQGSGNVKQRHRCPRGRHAVRRHGRLRCVPRHRHHGAGAGKRPADPNRAGGR